MSDPKSAESNENQAPKLGFFSRLFGGGENAAGPQAPQEAQKSPQTEFKVHDSVNFDPKQPRAKDGYDDYSFKNLAKGSLDDLAHPTARSDKFNPVVTSGGERTSGITSNKTETTKTHKEIGSDGQIHDTNRPKDDLKAKAEQVQDDVKRRLETTKDEVKAKAEQLADRAKEKFGELKTEARDKAEQAKDKTEQVKNDVKTKAADFADQAKEKLSNLKNDVKDKAEQTKTDAKAKAADFADQAKEKLANLKNDVKDNAEQAKGDAKAKASNVADQAKEKLNDLKSEAKDKTDQAKQKAANTSDDIKQQFDRYLENNKDKVQEVKQKAQDVKDSAANAVNTAQRAGSEVANKAADVVGRDNIESVKNAVNKAENTVAEVVEGDSAEPVETAHGYVRGLSSTFNRFIEASPIFLTQYKKDNVFIVNRRIRNISHAAFCTGVLFTSLKLRRGLFRSLKTTAIVTVLTGFVFNPEPFNPFLRKTPFFKPVEEI